MAAPASLGVMARSPSQQAGELGLRLGASERSRTGRQAVTAFLVRTTSAGLLYLSQVARALDGCLRLRHLRFRVDVGAHVGQSRHSRVVDRRAAPYPAASSGCGRCGSSWAWVRTFGAFRSRLALPSPLRSSPAWGPRSCRPYCCGAACGGSSRPGRTAAFALWLKTALPFWLMVACDLTLEIADVLMISSYLGPAEVGMYFAAAKTMSLVLIIHYAVASALAHRIATLDGRGEEEDLRAAVADAANWSFWPSLAAGAAIGLSARPCSGSSIVSGAPTLWSPRLAWAAPPRRRALPSLPLRPAIARSPDGGSTFRRQSGTTSTVRGGLLVSPEPGGGGRIARACQDRPARPAWSRRRPTIGGRRPRVRARGGCVPA